MTENSIPKITCILPVQQVQAPQFQVHISYFLQNCKKGKPPKKVCPSLKNDITDSEQVSKFKIHSRYQKLVQVVIWYEYHTNLMS